MTESAQQYIGTGLSAHLWNGLFIFITVIIAGFCLKYFLKTIGRKLILKTDTELDDQLLDAILARLKWLAIVIGCYLAIEEIAKGW